jgi:ADP-ribosylglycohydrolase
MQGYGSHSQPPGTWSDDTSLALCLADSLSRDFNPPDIARNFVLWYGEGAFTARGNVFDIGISTAKAALWSFLATDTYRDAVLKAASPGDDTDTTAAVTGGLARLCYGLEAIPSDWLEILAARTDICRIAKNMAAGLAS